MDEIAEAEPLAPLQRWLNEAWKGEPRAHAIPWPRRPPASRPSARLMGTWETQRLAAAHFYGRPLPGRCSQSEIPPRTILTATAARIMPIIRFSTLAP